MKPKIKRKKEEKERKKKIEVMNDRWGMVLLAQRILRA